MPRRDFIRGGGEIAKRDLLPREFFLDQRLQPARVLHPVGERISYDGNVIALFEFEFVRRRGVKRGEERERGCGGDEWTEVHGIKGASWF